MVTTITKQQKVIRNTKNSDKYTDLEFEDLVLAERCGCTIVTARNRKNGKTEVYLLVSQNGKH